jgi:NADH dehydrogenase
VLLFEGGPEILATFGDKLSGKATRELERIGVEIHVRSIVTHLDAEVGTALLGEDENLGRRCRSLASS